MVYECFRDDPDQIICIIDNIAIACPAGKKGKNVSVPPFEV